MSGLAALLAGAPRPGIYRWHGDFDAADVRHTVEHAGWRFAHLDGWRRRDQGRRSWPRSGQALDFPGHYGQNLDASPTACATSCRRPRHVLLWDGWGRFARADARRSSVALRCSAAGNAERGAPFAVLLRGEGPSETTSPGSTDRRVGAAVAAT